MMKANWQFTVLLTVAALFVGYLLGRSGGLPRAEAQNMGAVAGKLAVVIGAPSRGYYPVVIVDSIEESIMCYEYYEPDDSLELAAVRTFRFDKQIQALRNKGLTIEEVRKGLERRP